MPSHYEIIASLGYNIIVKITNNQIALELGTSRTVINRVLQDLKNKNLIKLSRGKITLLN